MAVGTGVDAQFGMVAEVTYGTAVTVTRFLEFQQESIKVALGQYMPMLLGRGQATMRGANVRTYTTGGGGDTVHTLQTVGFGLLLKMCLGAVNTVGAAAPYTHTFTPDTSGLQGISATLQVGRPSINGTVQPFTYAGAKVVKWKLEGKVDDAVVLTVTWDVKSETTATPLASKSYASSGADLIFTDGSATIDSASISIKSFSIECDNGLAVGRRFIGNTKKEPLRNGELAITGNLEYEFEGLTRHTALVAGTLLNSLVLTFATGTDSDGIVATIPQMIYMPGGEPTVGGPDIVAESMPWKATDNDTDDIISLAYITSDATP